MMSRLRAAPPGGGSDMGFNGGDIADIGFNVTRSRVARPREHTRRQTTLRRPCFFSTKFSGTNSDKSVPWYMSTRYIEDF